MRKRMAGYVRVSKKPKPPKESEKQEEVKGGSIGTQTKRLRAEAKLKGWDLTIYEEPGISAKDNDRPAYQERRRDLRGGCG